MIFDSMSLPPPIPVRLTTLPAHKCGYLPDRLATMRAFRADQLSPAVYQRFMDAGFRRSGNIVYQPVCGDCSKCIPIRVRVDRFHPSKSQRRCLKLNQDLIVTQAAPSLSDEKFELYRRYQIEWHGISVEKADDREGVKAFLYDSPVHTLEFCYRTPQGKLLAVGIADVCKQSLSSVYFYFDPDASARSLGTYSAMREIEWCRFTDVEFYYLGFWIDGCPTMEYKSRYRPAEILGRDGIWCELPVERGT